jgi:predicted secreted protein
MGVAGSIMAYVIVWWLVLFCLLPIGVRSQAEEGQVVPGSEPGAPQNGQLLWKAKWASIIALGIWAVMYVTINYYLMPPRA